MFEIRKRVKSRPQNEQKETLILIDDIEEMIDSVVSAVNGPFSFYFAYPILFHTSQSLLLGVFYEVDLTKPNFVVLARDPEDSKLATKIDNDLKELSELIQDVFWPFRDAEPESSEEEAKPPTDSPSKEPDRSVSDSESSDEELRRQKYVIIFFSPELIHILSKNHFHV